MQPAAATFEREERRTITKRFIRTDFYFDPASDPYRDASYFNHSISSSTALSALWITDQSVITALLEDYRPIYHPPELEDQPWGAQDYIGCLAALVRHSDRYSVPGDVASDANSLSYPTAGASLTIEQLIAVDVIEQSIIIERSPPVAEVLSALLHKATSTSLGVMLGVSITDNPYMLLATIPGGVILMGMAFGISKGLEHGLAKRVEKLVNPTRRRAPPNKS